MKRPELLKICREKRMRNYGNLKKSELAKLLGIELPERLTRNKKNSELRKPIRIEILDRETGTFTKYSSLNKTAKFLKVYPMQIYVLIAKGNAKFSER